MISKRRIYQKYLDLILISFFFISSDQSLASSFLKAYKNPESEEHKKIVQIIIKTEKPKVLKLADKLLKEKPITVTSNTCLRSAGGRHDYYSEGDYWWPDSLNPGGPYIRRDGISNPDNFNHHRKALGQFSWTVGTLTSAYLLSGEEKYVRAAMLHLRAWFIDTTTLMNPHLLYAQAIKGVCTGRGIGIIDATSFIEIAQSVSIVEKSSFVSSEEIYKIKNWFKEFLNWITTHQYGIDEMNWHNNHGTWWHAQAAAFSKLVENYDILDTCEQHFKTRLLPRQMAVNGSFPFELERTKPFSYSLFNLDGMAVTAFLISRNEENIWNYTLSDGRGMEKGMEFIFPFLKDKSKWTYPKDVQHWDEQPGRRACLFLAALSTGNKKYIDLWKTIEDKYESEESKRNSPLKNPVLWLGLSDPLATRTYK